MGKATKYWIDHARYDLDTAKAMFESGRYLYVLFCCQQAVEKMLKALIAHKTQQLPPRVHQLVRLAEAAGLEVDEDQADFLRELSVYYIQTRYPEETAAQGLGIKAETARKILDRTEETTKWLESML